VTILVGGVSQLYQGDFDLGRHAAERLCTEPLGSGVLVEELHYGAVAVVQRLQDLDPRALVLVGAEARGRAPGTLQRRRIRPAGLPQEQLQQAVRDAVTGYVTIDLLVEVAEGLGALPHRTVSIEFEPVLTEVGEELSPAATAGLEEALQLVQTEIDRIPLLELADELRPLATTERLGPSPALDTMCALLRELEILDEQGRWGATFSLRDRLRRTIADGQTGEGMEHLDWGLWWTLIEELDRLQARDVAR
jgi:Ni,Fe-hydrogenase maturation factor